MSEIKITTIGELTPEMIDKALSKALSIDRGFDVVVTSYPKKKVEKKEEE